MLLIKGVNINRKILASLAVENPAAFSEVVNFSAKLIFFPSLNNPDYFGIVLRGYYFKFLLHFHD